MPPPLQEHGAGTLPPSKPHPRLLSFLLKAIIMTLLTSCFFLILPLATLLLFLPLLLRHHRRRSCCPSSPGFSPKLLRKLPYFRFLQETASRYSESGCVVCLDGFRQGQSCRQLVGCSHVFHRKCVDSWLLKVAACPTCREQVRLGDDRIQGLVDL